MVIIGASSEVVAFEVIVLIGLASLVVCGMCDAYCAISNSNGPIYFAIGFCLICACCIIAFSIAFSLRFWFASTN